MNAAVLENSIQTLVSLVYKVYIKETDIFFIIVHEWTYVFQSGRGLNPSERLQIMWMWWGKAWNKHRCKSHRDYLFQIYTYINTWSLLGLFYSSSSLVETHTQQCLRGCRGVCVCVCEMITYCSTLTALTGNTQPAGCVWGLEISRTFPAVRSFTASYLFIVRAFKRILVRDSASSHERLFKSQRSNVTWVVRLVQT